MQTRNLINAVLVLAFAVVVAWFGTFPALAAEGNREKSSDYYEDALERFAKGEYRATIIQLKNSRKEDPRNLSALVLLGRVYMLLGRGAAAEREFRLAQQLGADDEMILMWIAESLLMQRKFQELFEQVPIGGHSPELEAKIRVIRGRAQVEKGHLDNAEDLFNEASRLQPNDPEPMVALAAVYLQRNKLHLAEDQADLATTIAPDYGGGWKLKGDIRRLKQDFTAALQGYDQAITADPRDFVARSSRAAVLMDLQRHEEALKDIEVIRAAQPLNAHANYLYAIILARNGEAEKSEAAMRRASQAIESMGHEYIRGHMPTLLLAANIHFHQKQFDRAHNELERYVYLVPNHPGASKMLGSILLMRRKTDRAVSVLEPALQMRPGDPQLLALLGSGYMKQRRFSEAAILLEKAAELAPDLASVRTQLAMVNLATGKRGKAVDGLKSAATLDPEGTNPNLLRGFIHLRSQEYQQALRIARELTQHEVDNPIGYNLEGAAYIGLGDLKAARGSFELALKVDKANGTAHHNLAKLDLQAGNISAAKRHYETAVDLNTGDTDAMAALSGIAEKQGDIENAIRWLEKLRASDPARIPEQIRLIGIYLQEKQQKVALGVARDLNSNHPNNIEALYALSQTLLATGNSQAARSTYKTMARVAGYNPPLLLRIAKDQITVRDLEEAHWSLQKAVHGAPKYLPAQAELVLLDAAMGEQSKALKRAASLRATYPDLALGYALTGDVLMQARRFDEAVEAFTAGMGRGPSPELAVRLYRARMQVAADDPAGKTAAVGELEQWVKANPKNIDTFRTLAAGYITVGQFKDARKLLEALLTKLPDDAAILNNLAVLAIKDKDPQALVYAKQSHKLAPLEPTTLDTLGWALVQAGEPGRALQYLRDANLRAAREPEIRYHLGVALHRMGRDDEARQQLKSALKTGQRFEGIEDARALLLKLSKAP